MLRIVGLAGAVSLLAMICLGALPAVLHAQTNSHAAGHKATKKAASKSTKRTSTGQPAARTGAVDRSIVPERHDARNGY